MAFKFLNNLIVGGVTFTFSIPDTLKTPVLQWLNAKAGNLGNNEGTRVLQQNDDIRNYTITQSPLQADKSGAPSSLTTYTIGTGTLELGYSGGVICYSFIDSSNNTINGVTNMVNNDNGGYCLVALVDDTYQIGILGYFATAYRLSGDNYIDFYINGVSTNYDKGYQVLTGAVPLQVGNGGGGASHVSKTTGLLSTLSQNISDILIVAGGGGGGGLIGTTPGNGGGYIGGSPKLGSIAVSGRSGTQSTGYAFGQGEAGGGGGGFYGGLAAQVGIAGAGAGSGYIANSLLTGEKKMYGNNIPTSTDADTYSVSNGTSSSSAISGYAKVGNGHVRFTYLRTAEPLEGTYFFKPTFATGSDGHDTIRYDTNDQMYIYGNSTLWNAKHSTQPNKAYSGQLVEDNWPYPFSESEKYDDFTIANNVLTLANSNANYPIGLIWNYGSVESVKECFPLNCEVTINLDFWLSNQTTDFIGCIDLMYAYTNASVLNNSGEAAGTVIYYGDATSGGDNSFALQNLLDEDGEESLITAQEWHNYKIVIQLSNGLPVHERYLVDDICILSYTDDHPTEFVNVVSGSRKCCYIRFQPDDYISTIKLRDFYISYKTEQTMPLYENLYFFKPTFATGTDGHDLARYDSSEQFYGMIEVIGDISDYVDTFFPNHAQPSKLYSGQLTDGSWAIYDASSEPEIVVSYADNNRFNGFSIGNNKLTMLESDKIHWHFGPQISHYNMIPENCIFTINYNFKCSSSRENDVYMYLYYNYGERLYDLDTEIHTALYDSSVELLIFDVDYLTNGQVNVQVVYTVSNGEITERKYYVDNDLKYTTSSWEGPAPNVFGSYDYCCGIEIINLEAGDEISNLYIAITTE